MKKIYFSLLLLSLFCINVFATVRDSVCIVRPEYSDDLSKKVKSLAKEFEEFGYEDIAEIFTNSVEKGAFGSGFVYKHNGDFFVLTNQHVIAYAEAVTIEFQNSKGDVIKKLEHCKIVNSNEELDLGIIKLPKNSGIQQSLALYNKTVKDGFDVFSAGYPGLGSDPAWQLGKGSITNAMTKIDDLIDSKKSYLIQHSAPIDPGNSGGPLLLASSAHKSGYVVVGVNEAKAVYRETTNFAIPVATINRFVNDSFSTLSKDEKEKLLTAACESFIDNKKLSDKINKATFTKIRQLMLMLDNEYALKNGYKPLKELLLKAPSEIRKGAISCIRSSFPVDALKFAVAYEMLIILQDHPELAITDKTLNTQSKASVDFNYNEDKISSKWNFSNGAWRITDYSINGVSHYEKRDTEVDSSDKSSDKSTAKSVNIMTPSIMELHGGYKFFTLPNGKTSSGGFVSLGVHSNYIGGGMVFGLQQRIKSESGSGSGSSFNTPSILSKISMYIMLFADLHVPINFQTADCTIIPYLNTAIGLRMQPFYGDSSFFNFKEMFMAEFSPGLKFAFNTSRVPIMLGSGYVISRHANLNETKWLHGFNIFIGIGL